MSGCVTVSGPPRANWRWNKGTTDPVEPSTLPNRTVMQRMPEPVCRAWISSPWQYISASRFDAPITLVEGTCMACDCCDGFHPSNGRCVHSCGLIRDYKKDLDVLQKLGLMPGATMKARELFALLFQRIPSTRGICAYGDGIERSEEWKICSGPDGNPGYVATRRTGVFNEDRS